MAISGPWALEGSTRDLTFFIDISGKMIAHRRKKLKHENTKRRERHGKDNQAFFVISGFLQFRVFVFFLRAKQVQPIRGAARDI